MEVRMTANSVKLNELVDADELDLLTDLLLLWCEKNKRNPDDLLPKCDVILQRYRNGECNADRLFMGL
jgi:hypothetical protein